MPAINTYKTAMHMHTDRLLVVTPSESELKQMDAARSDRSDGHNIFPGHLGSSRTSL